MSAASFYDSQPAVRAGDLAAATRDRDELAGGGYYSNREAEEEEGVVGVDGWDRANLSRDKSRYRSTYTAAQPPQHHSFICYLTTENVSLSSFHCLQLGPKIPPGGDEVISG